MFHVQGCAGWGSSALVGSVATDVETDPAIQPACPLPFAGRANAILVEFQHHRRVFEGQSTGIEMNMFHYMFHYTLNIGHTYVDCNYFVDFRIHARNTQSLAVVVTPGRGGGHWRSAKCGEVQGFLEICRSGCSIVFQVLHG